MDGKPLAEVVWRPYAKPRLASMLEVLRGAHFLVAAAVLHRLLTPDLRYG